MPLTRREERPTRQGPIPELIARWLLGGFEAIPSIRELPPEISGALFDLFKDHAAPARQLFAAHDQYLRQQARRWGFKPPYAFEPAEVVTR